MRDDMTTGLDRVPERLRARAKDVQPFAPAAAAAFEEAADVVAQALRDTASVGLTLQQAASESGYSTDHLGRLIQRGKLRNVGRKHAPRVLRGDLPQKPRGTPETVEPPASAVDLDAINIASAARGIRSGRSAAYRGRAAG